jgi:Uma2 family endonuclease
MNQITLGTPSGPIEYPDSDGKPLADNTKQLRWITTLYGNLCLLYREDPNVFVAGDFLWYPVEGHPEIRQAPDALVVFGRPKGDRGSYQQWKENNIPMTVVFEVLSPNNTSEEMADKLHFYDEYGVEEYYEYDPDNNQLKAYVRRKEVLRRVRRVNGFVSPRLGVRFEMQQPEMVVYLPNGRPFRTLEELEVERLAAEQRARTAEQRAQTAEQRAQTAEQRAQTAEQRALTVEQRLARITELSRRTLRQEATSEELAELQRLVEEAGS